MSSDNHKDREKQLTDEAWRRLQSRLAFEPAQPKWANWPTASQAAEPTAQAEAPVSLLVAQPEEEPPVHEAELSRNGALKSADASRERRLFGWLRSRRKQWAAAAACCIVAAVVATPSGNEALAAILNKFRMQEVTVVQENDLRDLFYQVAPDGQTREQINKFGTFSQTSGKLQGQFTPEEAAKALGHKLTVPAELKDAKKNEVYVSPSNKLTFQLHVDEVNQAMKRLGAKKLLPESVDGKPITLELGETVNYRLGDDEKRLHASFSQQDVPVVTVDPSIPVSEALSAVLDFPLLPDHLKQALKQSSILSGGSVPLPVIANGETEKIGMNGTTVVLTANPTKERTYYSATWVKGGQLYNFNGGNMFTDRTSVVNKVKELMES